MAGQKVQTELKYGQPGPGGAVETGVSRRGKPLREICVAKNVEKLKISSQFLRNLHIILRNPLKSLQNILNYPLYNKNIDF